MKKIFTVVFISFIPWLGSAQVSPRDSDESGTLVLAARTENAVIISVDSKITVNDKQSISDKQNLKKDPARKLVDVGMNGSCALDGYLGVGGDKQFDVATSLREWVKKNPRVGVEQGLEGLLHAAEAAWNRRNFQDVTKLPGVPPRKPGDPITILICGDLVSGKPVIIRAMTVVKNDLTAGHETLKPSWGDMFYIDGILDTDIFLSLVTSPNGKLPDASLKPSAKELYSNVVGDIESNFAAKIALNNWVQEKEQSDSCASQTTQKSAQQCTISQWTPSQVGVLFTEMFLSVEKNRKDDVGPPNQARVITKCGRQITTVESKSWKSCAIANARVKSPKKSAKS